MRIGGACKWLDTEGTTVPVSNFRVTTVRKLQTLTSTEKHAWLLDILKHNLMALRIQIENVGRLPAPLRMWRIGSDLLPVATHPVTQAFYDDTDVEALIDKRLLWCGNKARELGVRLSFHPGQFVVLGSQNPGIRENSRVELQYHCDCFTRMGYTGWHPDGLSVNIHVGVKDAAVPAMRKLLKSSKSIANFVTLENDEFSWGAERIVETFGDIVPLVLDVHHYWIHEGERLDAKDKLVKAIKATWRGVQPKLHLAMSAPELCNAKPRSELHLAKLIDAGNTRAGLRVHSQTPWHTRSIDYAATFGFDIMWEGKDKNLGAIAIAKHLGKINKKFSLENSE